MDDREAVRVALLKAATTEKWVNVTTFAILVGLGLGILAILHG